MRVNEMFPPTQQELEEMIYELTKKLENEKHQDEWEDLAEKREELEKRLQELIIKDNAL